VPGILRRFLGNPAVKLIVSGRAKGTLVPFAFMPLAEDATTSMPSAAICAPLPPA
jgi:hypothetical protein